MKTILVTNDDGFRSEGITALAGALAPLGEVTIVAPMTEASAIGHALTLRRPLRLEPIAERIYAVDGTPTDCVNIAVTQVLKALPDLILSGSTRVGTWGTMSRTQGPWRARSRAHCSGFPRSPCRSNTRAVSSTSAMPHRRRPRWPTRSSVSRSPRGRSSTSTPRLDGRRGSRVTVQAKRNHITSVGERHDPKGRPYYWIEEGQDEWEPHDRSDYQAVRDGYVSVTPLQPDLTAHHALAAVEALSFETEAEVEIVFPSGRGSAW